MLRFTMLSSVMSIDTFWQLLLAGGVIGALVGHFGFRLGVQGTGIGVVIFLVGTSVVGGLYVLREIVRALFS